jgi:hypothetical protein
MYMKINVIGDIHGRTNWKDLVLEDAVNVFVGDYFDPYERVIADDLMINFTDICEYARNHPDNTILLYGNHDIHYIVPEYGGTTSRYDTWNADKFKELFDDYSSLFHGIAYAPDHMHLITHAGVTKDWLDKYLDTDDFTGVYTPEGSKVPNTKEMELFINDLWEKDKSAFSFYRNCDIYDTYGTTPTQSPIWVRPDTLAFCNAYKGTGIIQIVGHTQLKRLVDISEERGLILVDCLGQATESYKFNTVD